MKEIRKLVSELKDGDDVKGYGVVARLDNWGDSSRYRVWPKHYGEHTQCDRWPADAEVTVLVKEKRWRKTVTYETTSADLAAIWNGASWRDYLSDGRIQAHGPVEEVES